MLAICSSPFISSRTEKSHGLQTLTTTTFKWAAGFLSKIHTEAVYLKLGNSTTISRAPLELICLKSIFHKSRCLSGLFESSILTIANRIKYFPFILTKHNSMSLGIKISFALKTVSGWHQCVTDEAILINKKYLSSMYQLELVIFKFVKIIFSSINAFKIILVVSICSYNMSKERKEETKNTQYWILCTLCRMLAYFLSLPDFGRVWIFFFLDAPCHSSPRLLLFPPISCVSFYFITP